MRRNTTALLLCTMIALAGCAKGKGEDPPGMTDGGGECTDLCSTGERICRSRGFQECDDFDADPCLEWSPTTECAAGETCEDGECRSDGCTDQCTTGSVRCTSDGTAVEACELDAASGCLVWADPAPCTMDRVCSGGRCMDPSECSDECAEDSHQCADDGFQTCGNTDADPCLEWGEVTACPSGETCSGGSCAESCTNECTEGSRECASGGDGFRACGNVDGDSCLEWGSMELCPDGQTCSGGECSATCKDECDAGDTRCNGAGTGVQECGDHDSDDCLELGPTTDCGTDETCQVDGGVAMCTAICDCDFNSSVCEPESDPSTTACGCDPDCAGGASPCADDGHCDTWCPAGADPDCGCGCDFNAYCEAESDGTTTTCSCDPSCDLNETACADDAHCDTFCPSGADPDCGRAEPCEERWINIGYRDGDQTDLAGEFANPDPDEGAPWIVLSQIGFASGTAEMTVKMAEDELSCVDTIRVEAYGYDNSGSDSCTDFGLANGGEVYIYNYSTDSFDLLPDPVDSNDPEWHRNDVTASISDYLRCPGGGDVYCYVRAKVEGTGWDCTHIEKLQVQVYLSP